MAETREHADPDEPDVTAAADEAIGGSERPPRLEDVLSHLRGRAAACEPPIGVGSFDVLYASSREVVVWYSPARPEPRPGEVAIPTARLATAWSALVGGEALDEAALERIAEGAALGRWLLAVLAQVPGVTVREEPSLVLVWAPPPESAREAVAAQDSGTSSETGAVVTTPRRRRKRAV